MGYHTGGEKTNIDWACTCIIEVISESTDVVESLTMIEKIRTNIDEALTVEHLHLAGRLGDTDRGGGGG